MYKTNTKQLSSIVEDSVTIDLQKQSPSGESDSREQSPKDSVQKIELITRNLQEVIGGEILKKIVSHRPLKVYWGTAPTGEIHLGYLVPLMKLSDFLEAGCEVSVLLADLHAFLDAQKSTIEQLEARTQYYQVVIRELLLLLDVDVSLLKFVRGTSFQLQPDYTRDVYQFNSHLSVNAAKSAGAEVVKQSDNPMMTGLLYPVLQCLDEVYLDVDCQFGGVDQRKIFALARDYLPKIGHRKRIHLMNPIVPGLSRTSLRDPDSGTVELTGKMSASDGNAKINILDSAKQIRKKVNTTYCLEGDVEDNTLLVLTERVIFPILSRRGSSFRITQPEKFGGQVWDYSTFGDLRSALEEKTLHPADFKQGVADFLVALFEPIRKQFEVEPLKSIYRKAYS